MPLKAGRANPFRLKLNFSPRYSSDEAYKIIEEFFIDFIQGEDEESAALSWEDFLTALYDDKIDVREDVLNAVFEHTPQLILKVEPRCASYKQAAEIAVKHKPMLRVLCHVQQSG